ncbi:MAG: response regulator [Chloroflexi bacterium]|nr:response regulator [Chloroflexota bacterium]
MNTVSVKEAFFLYVEDDASNRTVMNLIMEKAMGARNLVIFEDSANFMERVRALPKCPDAFLLDIHVHPYNGFEMLKQLRTDPEYRHVKVIGLTASVTNEEVEELRDAGFDGAIGKPLNISTFPDLMARILKGETIWFVS